MLDRQFAQAERHGLARLPAEASLIDRHDREREVEGRDPAAHRRRSQDPFASGQFRWQEQDYPITARLGQIDALLALASGG